MKNSREISVEGWNHSGSKIITLSELASQLLETRAELAFTEAHFEWTSGHCACSALIRNYLHKSSLLSTGSTRSLSTVSLLQRSKQLVNDMTH